jgi:hypothetical protein
MMPSGGRIWILGGFCASSPRDALLHFDLNEEALALGVKPDRLAAEGNGSFFSVRHTLALSADMPAG